jgi:four helix bundle protein
MTDNSFAPFPHHRLIAYQVALDFVRLIRVTPIADAESRKHANASAASCARNLAEGAGRRSRADKQRVYGIALDEL